MQQKLALEGGKPIRQNPTDIRPMIGQEEIDAVTEVLRSGKLTALTGEKTKRFEDEFGQYHGVKHAIATSSGTSALHVALAAAGVEVGDEVIVPPFTFVATASSVLHQNAIPVFADIDHKTYNIDPESISKRITEKTKAIIPVHIFGQPADMDPIMEIADSHRLIVIEDVAQAPGAKYKGRKVGTIGHIGCFSFYQTKNMTTGEGGMVITNDDQIDENARLVRHHGEPSWYKYLRLGYNYRMTELQAALGLVQLRKLDKFNRMRIDRAHFYTEHLEDIPGLILPYEASNVKHVWHVYVPQLDPSRIKVSRERFVDSMRAENVPVWVAYPTVLYLEALFQQKKGYGKGCPFACALHSPEITYSYGDCPTAEAVAKRCFTLFTDPCLTYDELTDTVRAVEKVAKAYS